MIDTLMLAPQLLGMDWMEPQWWLEHFGTEMVWLSLIILVIECGLFFPFLPGDTLLFAIGLFIAGDQVSVVPGHHSLDLVVVMALFIGAAFLGNVIGYEIGRAIGEPLYDRNGRFLKRKHFDQTHAFFERHGTQALVIGRFVPVVRTFVTVVAGVSRMDRRTFFTWSLVGAVLWVLSITLLGYFLGAIFPSLGEQLDKAIIVIVGVSLIPVAYEWWKHRRRAAIH